MEVWHGVAVALSVDAESVSVQFDCARWKCASSSGVVVERRGEADAVCDVDKSGEAEVVALVEEVVVPAVVVDAVDLS